MWACDLIVGADDTRFADVVGTRLGMCGVEYFAHPWEFGPRKAKELLLTGDAIDVDEAHRLGMVSKVFPADELADRTARVRPPHRPAPHDDRRCSSRSRSTRRSTTWASTTRCNACFTLHQLNHSHWAQVNDSGYPIAEPDSGVPHWKEAPPIVTAVKDQVRAEQ